MPVINVSDNFMINQQRVEKPQNRSRLRKFLGKEFFIIKRKIN